MRIAAYIRPVIEGLDHERGVPGQFERAHDLVQSRERALDLPLFDLRQILKAVEPRPDCISRSPFLQELQRAKVYALQFRKAQEVGPFLVAHALQSREHLSDLRGRFAALARGWGCMEM